MNTILSSICSFLFPVLLWLSLLMTIICLCAIALAEFLESSDRGANPFRELKAASALPPTLADRRRAQRRDRHHVRSMANAKCAMFNVQ